MLKINNINLTFNIGSINQKEALKNVSVEFKPGDFTTIIGGNGAGKSTLLNVIAGVYVPNSGEILIDGKNITKLPDYKRAVYFGRVFQDPLMGTAANMLIEENLSMAYRRGKKRSLKWGISSKERELYVSRLTDLGLGLEGRLKTKVGFLSGGQRQALTLVMASLVQPKVLLLDEHTAALDPKTAATVLNLTESIINKYKLTSIMVTHNMRDAINYGNRIIMMHEGRIILDISGQDKKNLHVADLLKMFERASGDEFADDSVLTSL
ncbi:MAG: ABC transporter ATP-binding protein [Oscillospiraceae bacterium]|nr:ABC transporter ATP-binding protein [Oscillospiraceae bacterium]